MSNLAFFAHDFNDHQVRVTSDRRFSVYDVLVAFGVTDKAHGAETFKRITDKHSEVLDFCVNFKFPGRGQKATPITDEEGMYQILMLCPGKSGAAFRKWAAGIIADPDKAANHAIKGYLRQGRDRKWIEARLNGIVSRNDLTDLLKQHGVHGHGYAQCTNATYKGLLGGTAQQLKEQRGLTTKASLRDNLDVVENSAIQLAEALQQRKIKEVNARGNNQCADVCFEVAKKVRKVIED